MMRRNKSQLREWIESIIIAVIIALVIKAFFIETIQVDGSSMLPTLNNGERLVVNKIGYILGKPEKGDIVIFKYPANPSLIFIKRIIGVSGDTVEIRNHKVFVNGYELDETYIMEKTIANYPAATVPENTVFVLGDNRNYSKDSRYPDVGFVPLKNVKGEAFIKIWPLPIQKINQKKD